MATYLLNSPAMPLPPQPLPSMGGGAFSGAIGGCSPRGAGPPNRLVLLCRLNEGGKVVSLRHR